ncbi:putative ribonuclease H-like domain-containing protein [Tanacetum coccineum]
MDDQDTPPPTITAMKIPIIKKGKYDIWSMRMRQYICHTDHNMWDIIVNGDLEDEATPSGEQSSPLVPKTAKHLAARRNQERIKSILLFAIPDKYLLKFHNVLDAKSLWAAIKSRFGGNEESKKMQKNVLKHHHLEIHRAYVSKEDINQKFLRSLPPSWSQIELIMRNKPDIDEIDIDDLYNNLRVYEDEMKKSSTFLSNTQNLAFLSYENTNITNEVSTTSGDFGVSTAGGINQVPSTLSAHDIAYSFLAQPTTSPQVENEDFQTGKNMDFKEKRPVSLDKSKIECYNYHRKGHFTREYRSGRTLVAQDGLGGYDWSNDFEVEPVNYALIAISSSSSSSSSNSKVQKCSKCLESFKCLQKNYDTEREKHSKAKLESRGYEIALESLEAIILGYKKNELAWGERYEFQDYDLKCREIKINNLNLELEKVVKERDELKLQIEKWEGSSKNLTKILNSQMSTHDKNGLGFGTQMDDLSNKSETNSENSLTVFKVRSSDEESTLANNSTDHLIKDYDFYKSPEPRVKNVVNTGERVVKPVWDYGKRDHAVDGYGSLSHNDWHKSHIFQTMKISMEALWLLEVISKEMPEDEQVWQDELEMMVTQELVATSTNQLSTDRPFVSTDRSFVSTDRSNTPNVSAASTSTCANADESSFVYLGGKIPIDASTLPNADLPIDPNMPDLEDAFDTLPNDEIFNRAYDDDKYVGEVADFHNTDNTIAVSPIPTLRIHKDHPKGQILGDPTSVVQTRGKIQKASSAQQALFKLQQVWILVDLPFGKKAIGTKWIFRNKRDERSIVVKNKARLVAQGHRQEEGIDYDEVFAPVARIEAIMLFLAFASYMGFLVYQMDVKSAFLYGTYQEEVYVHQPPGFVNSTHPNKVYKVVKDLYGLHQAPRAWYETLSSFLLENGFRRGTIDKTLFIKKNKSDIMLVQVYVDDIIFGSTKKSMCTEFEEVMHKRFQMSSIGELTFFLGLQVKQQPDGIFISQDKYVAVIIKKFDFCSIKTATTPIESNKPLVKDEDGVDVDVH